ncbi:MAG: hypothetical protein V7704_11795 [Aurantimonas endophytica]|uniref:hypothetical protein n=1 Tax=Aurantimonas endophytica TaxID=1522175 RepID=UPI00300371CC
MTTLDHKLLTVDGPHGTSGFVAGDWSAARCGATVAVQIPANKGEGSTHGIEEHLDVKTPAVRSSI